MKKSPPKPGASPASQLSFEQQIVEAFKKPQNWQYFDTPDFSLKAQLPRTPIRQTESFYDDALGKVEMVMYAGVGDNAMYILGQLRLPYSVTDGEVLGEFYAEMAKEMAGDKDFPLGETKDFLFDGKPGVEFLSKVSGPNFEPSRMRYILIGREVYMLLTMPYASEAGDDPLTPEARTQLRKEMDSFVASLARNEKYRNVEQTMANENDPVFESSFAAGVFSNKVLGFSLNIPDGWKMLTRQDVEGIRQWGRDLVTNNSTVKVPSPEKRQTLAMFTSGPLGAEDISTLNIVIGGAAADFSDVVKFAQFTENLLGGIKNYEVTVKPVETMFGNEKMMRLETKVRIGEQIQGQVILMWARKGRLIAFTLSHMEEGDKKFLTSILESLRLAG